MSRARNHSAYPPAVCACSAAASRQPQRDRGSFPHLALIIDAAAVVGHDIADDRHTKSNPETLVLNSGSKMRALISSGMPQPLSLTTISMRSARRRVRISSRCSPNPFSSIACSA